jgi:exodeoxyribonuclease V alpha subunit
MDFSEALETYLLETGQINALARRQARMLCKTVICESLQNEARILLLLNLAALNLGAPRAPGKFLIKPVRIDTVQFHISAYKEEHWGASPVWEEPLLSPDSEKTVSRILDELIKNPLRLAPLTGKEPADKDSLRYPLLVVGSLKKGVVIGFSRYWRAATLLEKTILAKLQQPLAGIKYSDAVKAIADVFGSDSILDGSTRFHYRQVAAAVLALRTRFLIVSGGPGTGKTSVVTQILRTILRADNTVRPDRIVLCAPTGRAKTRLGESIKEGIEALEKKPAASGSTERSLDLSLKNLQCKTIHGLLGARPDGSMKYNETNPLPFQVIVVDETSMVDLYLFSALLEAAERNCRIILVGDMHQLPSVEAGTVLGDLTSRFESNQTLGKDTAGWIAQTIKNALPQEASEDSLVLSQQESLDTAGPLVDHTVILTKSYRSVQKILVISGYVNSGETEKALGCLEATADRNVAALDTEEGIEPVKKWLKSSYTAGNLAPVRALRNLAIDAVEDSNHRDHKTAREKLENAFKAFNQNRVLTLANLGRRGRIAINVLADTLLRPQLDDGSRKKFFHGQQVILTQNLHSLNLFNGDTGIVVQSGNAGQKVVFNRGNRYLFHALEHLTGLEPAFAMTVHKAQGSEFDSVLLVLPEHKSPLLTRQVLYTGLTRAKKRIRILGTRENLQTAIDTREERPGGVEL